MIYVLYTVHIIVSLFLVLVVLLQQGKGADLSVFGGGSTQAAFGARGAATLLHKLTVGGFVVFVLTTLSISLLQGHGDRSSVMSAAAGEEVQVETEGPVAEPEPAAADGEGEAATPPPAGDGTGEAGAAPPPDAEAGTAGDGTGGG